MPRCAAAARDSDAELAPPAARLHRAEAVQGCRSTAQISFRNALMHTVQIAVSRMRLDFQTAGTSCGGSVIDPRGQAVVRAVIGTVRTAGGDEDAVDALALGCRDRSLRETGPARAHAGYIRWTDTPGAPCLRRLHRDRRTSPSPAPEFSGTNCLSCTSFTHRRVSRQALAPAGPAKFCIAQIVLLLSTYKETVVAFGFDEPRNSWPILPAQAEMSLREPLSLDLISMI